MISSVKFLISKFGSTNNTPEHSLLILGNSNRHQ